MANNQTEIVEINNIMNLGEFFRFFCRKTKIRIFLVYFSSTIDGSIVVHNVASNE